LMQNHITNKRVRVCENRKNTMQWRYPDPFCTTD
jgi:hypothetical protein